MLFPGEPRFAREHRIGIPPAASASPIRNGLAAPGSDGFLRRPCGGSLVVRPPLAFMLFGNPCRRRGTPDRPHAPSPPGDLRAAFQHPVPCSVGAAPLSARLREGISARGGRFPSPRTWIRRPRSGPSFVYSFIHLWAVLACIQAIIQDHLLWRSDMGTLFPGIQATHSVTNVK